MHKVNNLAHEMDNNNDSRANIEISGKVLGNNNRIDSIYVYYDERPTWATSVWYVGFQTLINS